jgi:hypothetical protein
MQSVRMCVRPVRELSRRPRSGHNNVCVFCLNRTIDITSIAISLSKSCVPPHWQSATRSCTICGAVIDPPDVLQVLQVLTLHVVLARFWATVAHSRLVFIFPCVSSSLSSSNPIPAIATHHHRLQTCVFRFLVIAHFCI